MRALIGSLILCCAVSAPPATAQEYLPGVADLIAAKALKVGMLAWDVPPMIVTSADGTVGGYDVRIAEAIARALGVKLSIVRTEMTANGVIDQVARGDVDIAVSYLSRTPSRSLKVLFTRPYLDQNHTLLLSRAFAARHGGGCPTTKAFLDSTEQTPVGIGCLPSAASFRHGATGLRSPSTVDDRSWFPFSTSSSTTSPSPWTRMAPA